MPICPHAILFPDMSPNGLACQIESKTFLLSDENLVNEYIVTFQRAMPMTAEI